MDNPVILIYSEGDGRWSMTCSDCGILYTSYFGPVLSTLMARHSSWHDLQARLAVDLRDLEEIA